MIEVNPISLYLPRHSERRGTSQIQNLLPESYIAKVVSGTFRLLVLVSSLTTASLNQAYKI